MNCDDVTGEFAAVEPARRWREQDGVIYFSITSDGMTGEEWIKRLENKGFRIGAYAKSVLQSKDFKPTNGITTEIAVLPGKFFSGNDRVTSKIRAEATKRKLIVPNAEAACLIREMFSSKEIEDMGLWWIITFHEPIKDLDDDLDLLGSERGIRDPWLNAYCGKPDDRWDSACGFAFAVS